MDRVDLNKTINVVEGPFDSLFIPNCVAVAGSDLKRALLMLPKDTTTLIFDNQPRNKDLVKIMRKHADDGYRMVFWPEIEQQKDINEMIQIGRSANNVYQTIKDNTYQGLAAQLQISDWSKV